MAVKKHIVKVNNKTMNLIDVYWDEKKHTCELCGALIGKGYTKKGILVCFNFNNNNSIHKH